MHVLGIAGRARGGGTGYDVCGSVMRLQGAVWISPLVSSESEECNS